jgi:hypothetical protein
MKLLLSAGTAHYASYARYSLEACIVHVLLISLGGWNTCIFSLLLQLGVPKVWHLY